MLAGVRIEKCFYAEDSRGAFLKIYSNTGEKFPDFKESYISISHKNVIRGMHFQIPPFDVDKLVTVLSGGVLDVVFDMRRKSPTYRKIFALRISPEDHIGIFIPSGCAHGFLAETDNTTLLYHVSKPYAPEYDKGIRYDSFGFQWPVAGIPILSDRDKNMPPFMETENQF